MPNPLVSAFRDHTFLNKHQNVTVVADTFYDVFNLWADAPSPATGVWRPGLEGLRSVVAEAERRGKRVRGLGGAWSLSEAAVTRDIMVNTKGLNHVELGFKESSLDAAFDGDRRALCFTQCGASVMELYQFLESRGYTLPTGGASNGQTIAGAVSTGTHGSANAVGAMQEFVLGLHLVLTGGRHVWLERASKPVVSAAFCQALGAELVKNDELFDAAVVSFGSFGMIHALLLQVEPLYLLEKSLIRVDYDVARKTFASLDVSSLELPDGDALPFHYEVVVDPYHTGAGQKGAYVRTMYKRPYQATTPLGSSASITPGDDVMGFLGAVTNPAPEVVPLIIEHVLGLQLKPVSGVLGTPGQHFGPTDTRGFIMSTEIGVAQQDADDAVDAVIAVARDFPWAGFPAVRWVRNSRATLAFTHFGPTSCTIELASAGSNRTKAAFERVWVELHRRKIPFTLHWGQCLRPSAIHFPSAYGERVAKWRMARQTLLGAAGGKVFGSDWLDALGLS